MTSYETLRRTSDTAAAGSFNPPRDFIPLAGTVVAVNMSGDSKFLKHKYPVAFAFLESKDEDSRKWTIRWYADYMIHKITEQRKVVKISKFWDNPRLFNRLKTTPTQQQILENWTRDTIQASWILPVHLPTPDSMTPEKLIMNDTVLYPADFIRDELIRVCKQHKCVH